MTTLSMHLGSLTVVCLGQIVVWRMLKESAVFFTLLGLLAIGFGQALTGLDVADEARDSTESTLFDSVVPNWR